VRLILEFLSTIWNLKQNNLIGKLENYDVLSNNIISASLIDIPLEIIATKLGIESFSKRLLNNILLYCVHK